MSASQDCANDTRGVEPNAGAGIEPTGAPPGPPALPLTASIPQEPYLPKLLRTQDGELIDPHYVHDHLMVFSNILESQMHFEFPYEVRLVAVDENGYENRSPRNKLTLKDLPLNVRNIIYGYVFADHDPDNTIIIMSRPKEIEPYWSVSSFKTYDQVLEAAFGPKLGGLCACRQLYRELIVFLFSTYHFFVVYSATTGGAFMAPMSTVVLPKYLDIVQHLTVEVDFTRFGGSADPETVHLNAGEGIIRKYLKVMADRIDERRGIIEMAHLHVLARQFAGHRPGITRADLEIQHPSVEHFADEVHPAYRDSLVSPTPPPPPAGLGIRVSTPERATSATEHVVAEPNDGAYTLSSGKQKLGNKVENSRVAITAAEKENAARRASFEVFSQIEIPEGRPPRSRTVSQQSKGKLAKAVAKTTIKEEDEGETDYVNITKSDFSSDDDMTALQTAEYAVVTSSSARRRVTITDAGRAIYRTLSNRIPGTGTHSLPLRRYNSLGPGISSHPETLEVEAGLMRRSGQHVRSLVAAGGDLVAASGDLVAASGDLVAAGGEFVAAGAARLAPSMPSQLAGDGPPSPPPVVAVPDRGSLGQMGVPYVEETTQHICDVFTVVAGLPRYVRVSGFSKAYTLQLAAGLGAIAFGDIRGCLRRPRMCAWPEGLPWGAVVTDDDGAGAGPASS